jgi:hypothetical protein
MTLFVVVHGRLLSAGSGPTIYGTKAIMVAAIAQRHKSQRATISFLIKGLGFLFPLVSVLYSPRYGSNVPSIPHHGISRFRAAAPAFAIAPTSMERRDLHVHILDVHSVSDVVRQHDPVERYNDKLRASLV